MQSDNKKPQQREIIHWSHPSAEAARIGVLAETNRNKFTIDRTVFSKTESEKSTLKTAKLKYKNLCKNPTKFKETQTALFQEILAHKKINFNVVFKVSNNN